MRYLPICVLLAALCLPTTSLGLAIAILCVSTLWMLCCLTQPHNPAVQINYESHVVDPFSEFMIGPPDDEDGPFGPNMPPNADGGDFDYD